MHHMEFKMGDFAATHNKLAYAHNECEEEMRLLKAKLVDLEERSHRNNIKFRGIVESVPPADLHNYVQNMIAVN